MKTKNKIEGKIKIKEKEKKRNQVYCS